MTITSFEHFFSSAEKLAATGNLNEAKAQLDSILNNQDLIKARAHNDLGVISYRQDEKDKALLHYQKAVKLAPKELIYRKNLADLCYFEFGDAQTALEHYRQIIVDKPNDFDAILAIGRICADLGKHFFSEATDFFDLAEKIRPGNEFVAMERSGVENMANINNKPSTEHLISNSEDTGNPAEIYTKISAGFQAQEAAATEKIILSFLEQFPNFALAHNDLGVISHQLEKLDQSGKCYQEAVRLDPDNNTFRKNLADFLFVIAGNPESAMEHYLATLKNNPKDTETLMMIGNICLALDSEEEAHNFFNLVLEQEPWHSDATQAIKMLNEKDRKINDKE